MPRAELTREGVLRAIAEFDTLGRVPFLERYGFNRARDYFLVHQGKRYDSKPIAAVAHKWAQGGGGRALTSIELSGGRADAARSLRVATQNDNHLDARSSAFPTHIRVRL
jgi:5-methylcytosine-specific restriction protein A